MLARYTILDIIFRNKSVIFLSFSVNILCSEHVQSECCSTDGQLETVATPFNVFFFYILLTVHRVMILGK